MSDAKFFVGFLGSFGFLFWRLFGFCFSLYCKYLIKQSTSEYKLLSVLLTRIFALLLVTESQMLQNPQTCSLVSVQVKMYACYLAVL